MQSPSWPMSCKMILRNKSSPSVRTQASLYLLRSFSIASCWHLQGELLRCGECRALRRHAAWSSSALWMPQVWLVAELTLQPPGQGAGMSCGSHFFDSMAATACMITARARHFACNRHARRRCSLCRWPSFARRCVRRATTAAIRDASCPQPP